MPHCELVQQQRKDSRRVSGFLTRTSYCGDGIKLTYMISVDTALDLPATNAASIDLLGATGPVTVYR